MALLQKRRTVVRQPAFSGSSTAHVFLRRWRIMVSSASTQHGSSFRFAGETSDLSLGLANAEMQLCARWSEPSYQKSHISGHSPFMWPFFSLPTEKGLPCWLRSFKIQTYCCALLWTNLIDQKGYDQTWVSWSLPPLIPPPLIPLTTLAFPIPTPLHFSHSLIHTYYTLPRLAYGEYTP